MYSAVDVILAPVVLFFNHFLSFCDIFLLFGGLMCGACASAFRFEPGLLKFDTVMGQFQKSAKNRSETEQKLKNRLFFQNPFKKQGISENLQKYLNEGVYSFALKMRT